ncbi:MAG: hypothetical protein ACE5I1_11150 [bacterium]
MEITKKIVADQLKAYLERRINLHVLAKWAKDTMMEGDFEQSHFELLRSVIARLGLADVDGFGLRRHEFQDFFKQLTSQ